MEYFKEQCQIDQNIEGILISSAAKNIIHKLTTSASRKYHNSRTNPIYAVFSTETISAYIIRLNDST